MRRSTTCWSWAPARAPTSPSRCSKGAKHVDAVEIDPRILQLGVRAQPRPRLPGPAGRPRTSTTAGRSCESTDTKYDLILFALPDSLALVNGASQIRLESFLFTEEALRSARDHLKPDGGFAMYNYYRENWLIDRLAGTAATAFGHAPCVDTFAEHQAVVTVARRRGQPGVRPGRTDPPPARRRAGDRQRAVPVLPGRACCQASTCGRSAASCCCPCCSCARWAGRSGRCGPTPTCSSWAPRSCCSRPRTSRRFALLFGTTWLVNALVFAGVLVIVLAAVETTRRFRTPPLPVVFAGDRGLAGAGLGGQARAGCWRCRSGRGWSAATLLAFLPIYLANIAFAKRFAARRGLPGGVRRQPARRDRRRLPGVRRAAHRLPQPADRGRRALPASRSCSSRRRRSPSHRACGQREQAWPRGGRPPGSGRRGWCRARPRRAARPSPGRRAASRPGGGAAPWRGRGSRSQLVVSAPTPGRQTWPPWVWPARIAS